MTDSFINGDYIDSNNQVRNLDGTWIGEAPPGLKETMSPWLGQFIGSDGEIHGIEELSGGGTGGVGPAGPRGEQGPPGPAGAPGADATYQPVQFTATIPIDGFTGIPPAYTLTNGSITQDRVGMIGLPVGATADDFDAFVHARLSVQFQAEGALTVCAFGTLPEIALPVLVTLL